MKKESKDIITDYPILPDETIIYYSKGKNLYQMVVSLCVGLLGIYITLNLDGLLEMGMWSIFSIVWFYVAFKNLIYITNRKPQIILNKKGVQTISTQFYSWSEIKEIEVISTGAGKFTHEYLIYKHPNGNEKLKIDYYNTTNKKLSKLLDLYREKR